MDTYLVPPGGIDRVPDYDARANDHFWVLPVAFRVDDPKAMWDSGGDPPMFDQENLVLAQTIGCWYCEEPYTPTLATRRCPGKPRE